MAQHATLSRSLTVKDLVIYGLVFMVPVAPIAVYGTFLSLAKGMVSLAYLVGMIAILFTGFSYFTMSKRYSFSGSVYNYVQKAAHPNIGFLAGWAIILDYIFMPVVCNLIGALFMSQLLPFIKTWIWLIIFSLINTTINCLGVKQLKLFSWTLFYLQIVVLLIFSVLSLKMLITHQIHFNLISFYNNNDFNFSSILQASGITILSFLGFDAISTLSEETYQPKKSIGKATMLSILLIGAIFIFTTMMAGMVYPDYTHLNSDTAFIAILQKVGGHYLVLLSTLSIVLSFGFACGLESQAAVSRIIFSMGRDGVFPPIFGRIHPKFKTPFIAIIFVGIVTFILSSFLTLDTVQNLISFGALLSFIVLNSTVIWHFYILDKKKSLKKFTEFFMFPLIGFLVCSLIFFKLSFEAHLVGSIWIGAGVIYLAAKTRGFSKNAPVLNEKEHADIIN